MNQEKVIQIFEDGTPSTINISKGPVRNSIRIHQTDDKFSTEFIRDTGQKVAKEVGYFVSGMRSRDEKTAIIWFDELPEGDNQTDVVYIAMLDGNVLGVYEDEGDIITAFKDLSISRADVVVNRHKVR